MPGPITFQLGPLPVAVEGDHLIARWAAEAFSPLRCDAVPGLRFRMVDHAVHPCDGAVGDGRMSVSADAASFTTRLFDVRLSRSAAMLDVQLRQRDRRPLWLRSLTDPEETWKLWLTHGANLDLHMLKEFAYSIAPLPLMIELLARRAALIHASAFAVDDGGVLLPAWGGVGKSTMVSRAVLHGGANFIADDHAVIDANGHMHLHLLPIHVYAYHLSNDAALKARALAGCSPASRRQWPIGATLRKSKAVRWISPAALFGEAKLARSARIEQVVVMFRGDGDSFEWRDCSPDEAARPATGVILREISGLTERIAGASAGWGGGIMPDLETVCRMIRETYTQAFSGARCAMVKTPRRSSPDDLCRHLASKSPLIAEALKLNAP